MSVHYIEAIEWIAFVKSSIEIIKLQLVQSPNFMLFGAIAVPFESFNKYYSIKSANRDVCCVYLASSVSRFFILSCRDDRFCMCAFFVSVSLLRLNIMVTHF